MQFAPRMSQHVVHSQATLLPFISNLANLNVYFDPAAVDGHQAPALKADLTVDEALSGSTPTSPEAIRTTIARFEEAGVDELVFTATTTDPMDSLDRLADVI